MEDVHILVQGIQAGTQFTGRQRLQDLLAVCSKLADDSIVLLMSLKINNQKNHRLESLRKSMESLHQNGGVGELERRLFKVQDQICAHPAILLR